MPVTVFNFISMIFQDIDTFILYLPPTASSFNDVSVVVMMASREFLYQYISSTQTASTVRFG